MAPFPRLVGGRSDVGLIRGMKDDRTPEPLRMKEGQRGVEGRRDMGGVDGKGIRVSAMEECIEVIH